MCNFNIIFQEVTAAQQDEKGEQETEVECSSSKSLQKHLTPTEAESNEKTGDMSSAASEVVIEKTVSGLKSESSSNKSEVDIPVKYSASESASSHLNTVELFKTRPGEETSRDESHETVAVDLGIDKNESQSTEFDLSMHVIANSDDGNGGERESNNTKEIHSAISELMSCHIPDSREFQDITKQQISVSDNIPHNENFEEICKEEKQQEIAAEDSENKSGKNTDCRVDLNCANTHGNSTNEKTEITTDTSKSTSDSERNIFAVFPVEKSDINNDTIMEVSESNSGSGKKSETEDSKDLIDNHKETSDATVEKGKLEIPGTVNKKPKFARKPIFKAAKKSKKDSKHKSASLGIGNSENVNEVTILEKAKLKYPCLKELRVALHTEDLKTPVQLSEKSLPLACKKTGDRFVKSRGRQSKKSLVTVSSTDMFKKTNSQKEVEKDFNTGEDLAELKNAHSVTEIDSNKPLKKRNRHAVEDEMCHQNSLTDSPDSAKPNTEQVLPVNGSNTECSLNEGVVSQYKRTKSLSGQSKNETETHLEKEEKIRAGRNIEERNNSKETQSSANKGKCRKSKQKHNGDTSENSGALSDLVSVESKQVERHSVLKKYPERSCKYRQQALEQRAAPLTQKNHSSSDAATKPKKKEIVSIKTVNPALNKTSLPKKKRKRKVKPWSWGNEKKRSKPKAKIQDATAGQSVDLKLSSNMSSNSELKHVESVLTDKSSATISQAVPDMQHDLEDDERHTVSENIESGHSVNADVCQSKEADSEKVYKQDHSDKDTDEKDNSGTKQKLKVPKKSRKRSKSRKTTKSNKKDLEGIFECSDIGQENPLINDGNLGGNRGVFVHDNVNALDNVENDINDEHFQNVSPDSGIQSLAGSPAGNESPNSVILAIDRSSSSANCTTSSLSGPIVQSASSTSKLTKEVPQITVTANGILSSVLCVTASSSAGSTSVTTSLKSSTETTTVFSKSEPLSSFTLSSGNHTVRSNSLLSNDHPLSCSHSVPSSLPSDISNVFSQSNIQFASTAVSPSKKKKRATFLQTRKASTLLQKGRLPTEEEKEQRLEDKFDYLSKVGVKTSMSDKITVMQLKEAEDNQKDTRTTLVETKDNLSDESKKETSNSVHLQTNTVKDSCAVVKNWLEERCEIESRPPLSNIDSALTESHNKNEEKMISEVEEGCVDEEKLERTVDMETSVVPSVLVSKTEKPFSKPRKKRGKKRKSQSNTKSKNASQKSEIDANSTKESNSVKNSDTLEISKEKPCNNSADRTEASDLKYSDLVCKSPNSKSNVSSVNLPFKPEENCNLSNSEEDEITVEAHKEKSKLPMDMRQDSVHLHESGIDEISSETVVDTDIENQIKAVIDSLSVENEENTGSVGENVTETSSSCVANSQSDNKIVTDVSKEMETNVPVKRKRGRPPLLHKKPKSRILPLKKKYHQRILTIKKMKGKPGRPPLKLNSEITIKRGPGRPKGSKNKVKLNIVKIKRSPGRPKGSLNKVKRKPDQGSSKGVVVQSEHVKNASVPQSVPSTLMQWRESQVLSGVDGEDKKKKSKTGRGPGRPRKHPLPTSQIKITKRNNLKTSAAKHGKAAGISNSTNRSSGDQNDKTIHISDNAENKATAIASGKPSSGLVDNKLKTKLGDKVKKRKDLKTKRVMQCSESVMSEGLIVPSRLDGNELDCMNDPGTREPAQSVSSFDSDNSGYGSNLFQRTTGIQQWMEMNHHKKKKNKKRLLYFRSKHKNIIDPVFNAEVELLTDLFPRLAICGETYLKVRPGEVPRPSIFKMVRIDVKKKKKDKLFVFEKAKPLKPKADDLFTKDKLKLGRRISMLGESFLDADGSGTSKSSCNLPPKKRHKLFSPQSSEGASDSTSKPEKRKVGRPRKQPLPSTTAQELPFGK